MAELDCAVLFVVCAALSSHPAIGITRGDDRAGVGRRVGVAVEGRFD